VPPSGHLGATEWSPTHNRQESGGSKPAELKLWLGSQSDSSRGPSPERTEMRLKASSRKSRAPGSRPPGLAQRVVGMEQALRPLLHPTACWECIACRQLSVEVVGLPVGVLEASPIEKVSPMAVGVLEAPPREADRRVRSEVGEPEARSLPVGGRHRVVALVQSE
jgi:hypothetical protein